MRIQVETVFCAILFYVAGLNGFVGANSAQDLKKYLFKDDRYDKAIRPVLNWQTQTVVDLHLSIITILDFDDVKETISITGILELTWTDEFLTWDTENFGNLSHISIPQNDVWRPYISLENSVLKMGELGTSSLTVDVHSNGKVDWRPVEVLVTSCAVDVSKFPFDTQRCGLIFEANGYDDEELHLNVNGSEVELHEYKGTSGWVIKSTKFDRSAEDEIMHIVCWITLERKPMYFILNIFLPICLLTLLNIFVFILPVESGEKVSFVVTVFLSLAVFLTIVSGEMPENSESVSLLNIYVFTSTVMSTITVILTIIQIRLHSNGTNHTIPRCLRAFSKLFTASKIQIDSEELESNDLKTASVIRGSINRRSVKSLGKTPFYPRMNWQRVAKSLDNFFFIIFLLFYVVFTLAWIIVATSS